MRFAEDYAWPRRPPGVRKRRRARLRARRTWRLAVIVTAAVAAGAAAVLFAKLCDLAMSLHHNLLLRADYLGPLLLLIALPLFAGITRRFAPASSGSGIPQVIAAAEARHGGEGGDPRVSLGTALYKLAATAALLLCGASIGREGPTVQVAAALVWTMTRARRHHGRSLRRSAWGDASLRGFRASL